MCFGNINFESVELVWGVTDRLNSFDLFGVDMEEVRMCNGEGCRLMRWRAVSYLSVTTPPTLLSC